MAFLEAATQGTCRGRPSTHGHCDAHRDDLHRDGHWPQGERQVEDH